MTALTLSHKHTHIRTVRRSNVCVRILRNVKNVLRTILSMSNKSVHIQNWICIHFYFSTPIQNACEWKTVLLLLRRVDLDRISNSMGLPRTFANSINRFDSHFLAIKFSFFFVFCLRLYKNHSTVSAILRFYDENR